MNLSYFDNFLLMKHSHRNHGNEVSDSGQKSIERKMRIARIFSSEEQRIIFFKF